MLVAGAKYNFGDRPCVFERVVVFKRNIQFPGDVLESITSTTELVRPCSTHYSGTVQPFDPKLFKPVTVQGSLQSNLIKRGMAHNNATLQPPTQFIAHFGDCRATLYVIIVNPMNEHVEWIEPILRVNQCLPIFCDFTLSDIDDANLTNACAICICRFYIDCVE